MTSKNTIFHLTTEDAQRFLGNIGLNHAKTLFHRESGDAEIIVDSGLPAHIQNAFLAHEMAQLAIIRDYARTGRSVDGVLGKAHEVGLAAGIEKARELGIMEEYLKIRGG